MSALAVVAFVLPACSDGASGSDTNGGEATTGSATDPTTADPTTHSTANSGSGPSPIACDEAAEPTAVARHTEDGVRP